MYRLSILTLVSVLALASVLACHAFKSESANTSRHPEDEKNPEVGLLHKYGWTVASDPTDGKLDLPNTVTRILSTRLYLQASKTISLDFSNYAGQTLALRSYKVTNEAERGHDIRAHLLLAEKNVVGAWLSVENEDISPGIYALSVNPHKRKLAVAPDPNRNLEL
jgi:uncharacterized protein DUF4830